MKFEYKHVKRVIRRNKNRPDAIYWYSETPGLERVRIAAPDGTPYEPGSDEFVRFINHRNSIGGAKTRTARPELGTFYHLADLYFGNEELGIEPDRTFTRLSDRTKKDYRKYSDTILERFGPHPVSAMNAEICGLFLDSFKDKKVTGNHHLALLTVLLNLAVRRKSIFGLSQNPAKEVQRYGALDGIEPRRSYWTDENEDLFLEVASTGFWFPKKQPKTGRWRLYYRARDEQVVLYYHLLAYTGQRPGDVLEMMLSDYDGEKISVMQNKRKARLRIKCHERLKPLLDAEVARARKEEVINRTFITQHDGEPLKERRAAERWDDALWAAGLEKQDLHRQDLRRTAVIRLSEAECTIPQIAAITGHSLTSVDKILETYWIATEGTADAAITKLEDYQKSLREKGAIR